MSWGFYTVWSFQPQKQWKMTLTFFLEPQRTSLFVLFEPQNKEKYQVFTLKNMEAANIWYFWLKKIFDYIYGQQQSFNVFWVFLHSVMTSFYSSFHCFIATTRSRDSHGMLQRVIQRYCLQFHLIDYWSQSHSCISWIQSLLMVTEHVLLLIHQNSKW